MELQVKRVFIIIITGLLIIPFLPVKKGYAGEKKRMAVLDFSANNLPETYARVVRNFLETSLFETGRFQMLEREKVEMVFRENRIRQGYPEKTSHTVKIGKTLSVDYAIVGSLDRVENYTLTARVVSINEGRIIFAHTENISSLSRLHPAAESLSRKIVSALSGEKIVRQERVPVKPGVRAGRNIFLNASFDSLTPYGSLEDAAGRGRGFNLAVEYHGLLSRGAALFLRTGYWRFGGSKSDPEIYSVVPVSLGLGYRIGLPLRFFLVPQVSGGGALISRGDGGRNNFFESGNRKDPKFDPLSEAGIVLGWRVTDGFHLSLRGGWGGFWEKEGIKQYAVFGAGLGIGF